MINYIPARAMRTGTAAAVAVGFLLQAAPVCGQTNGPPTWDTTIAVGMNITRGNSRTLLANGSVAAERKDGKNDLRLGVQGNYGNAETTTETGETRTEKNVQNGRAYAEDKRLFTERAYSYFNAEVSEDDIADIKYRFVVGPGLGYYVVKTDAQALGLELGLAYIRDKVGERKDDRTAVRVGERYEAKLSPTAKLWQSAEYLADITDFGNFLVNANAEAGIETAINNHLSLRVVMQDKYNSRPAEGKDRNDLVLLSGLVYKL